MGFVAVASELRRCKSLLLGTAVRFAGTPALAFCCLCAEGRAKHRNPESSSPEEKGIADVGDRRSKTPCGKWMLSDVDVN